MTTTQRVLSVVFAMVLVLSLITPALAADASAQAGKININKASAEELTQLKRVGPSYAARIVSFRENNGPFKAPEDIMMVPGIGQKTFDLNKDLIVVED